MGMDIYTGHGVVFTAEEILPKLFGKLGKGATSNLLEAIQAAFTAREQEQFPESFKALDSVKTGAEFAQWFIGLMEEGLVDSYGDRYYSDESFLQTVWSLAEQEAAIDHILPTVSFEYWSNGRLNGFDVPVDTPCLVFADDDLFETKMTEEGKKLAKLLKMKRIVSTTWTVMSV